MKRLILPILALVTSVTAMADNVTVSSFRHSGPYKIQKPFMVDTVDVNSKPFEIKSILDSPLCTDALKSSGLISGDALPKSDGYSIAALGFSIQNTAYTSATMKIDGLKDYKVIVDGKESSGSLSLEPAVHEVEIRYVAGPDENVSCKVDIESPKEIKVIEDNFGKHFYGIKDVLLGTRIADARISPSGTYMIVSYKTTIEGGKTTTRSCIKEVATGKIISEKSDATWMSGKDVCWYTRKTGEGTDLIAFEPSNGTESILAKNIPDGWFELAPTNDWLLYTMSEDGPAEKPEIYQILEPDDRQPGWRSRSYVAKYDLNTGVMQPLTFGYHNSYVLDISSDGKSALLQTNESRLTERPTTLMNLYLFNLETLEAEPLVEKDGFMGGASFSPDGKRIILLGTPEAFGGIGKNVPEGVIPSMTDNQLYVMDLSTKKITPMTKDFDPCVQTAKWCKYDGKIYFTAENRDLYSLYRLDPTSGKISQIDVKEDLVNSFSLAETAPAMVYYGQGAMNSDRLYSLDLKKNKTTMLEDLSAVILKDVELGECHEWNFTNSRGDTIYGRYYLPPHFDPSKKYPMIVNYYGGCSPTSRNFESRYPHHAYAALGYVVYIVEPSGATGFGQEFSSRHVNTAGVGPAEDIIEGTKLFCKEHGFVNEKKIGCIGASYGGFMTQYLQTVTDIFAAAISHAGISDHTSYWGNGYWGYSYSEVSMAGSYPWSDRELYVDRSPLYNADKIHTPLLFVHGDSDHNVPFGESIQMFTALKLLGRETAFVAVTGQDHHILDYNKRIMWQNTIWAWFAKYLQDDPTWWDSLYAPKSL